MTNTRTIIAIALFILFIISRATDMMTTYYYSPDLAFEANPFVIMAGNQWSTIFWIFAFAIVLIGLLCFRLAKRDYNTPFISEKIAYQVFNKPIKKTAKRRYVDDFYTVFGIILVGFGAAICWLILHTYRVDFANQIAGIVIYNVPLYVIFLIMVSFASSYLTGNKVVDKYLPELNK